MTTFDQHGQTVYGDQYNVAGDLFVDKVEIVLPAPADAADRRNLAILRDKVKSFWIEGVLEKSLYNEVLIELLRSWQTFLLQSLALLCLG